MKRNLKDIAERMINELVVPEYNCFPSTWDTEDFWQVSIEVMNAVDGKVFLVAQQNKHTGEYEFGTEVVYYGRGLASDDRHGKPKNYPSMMHMIQAFNKAYMQE
ncbi:hypothetical protein 015DV004_24 [Bacillus phage 015DV004]|nr:hypothetical protein 015DV004_24 [Bacillus phage 015DV004]